MPSPDLVAASQSERTEAQARERVTWPKLQELVVAVMTAKKAYLAHKRPLEQTPDEAIAFDMAENELLSTKVKADIAYQSALKRYQEQRS